jgi:hypothetical protein
MAAGQGAASRTLRRSLGVAGFLAMAVVVAVAIMPLGRWPLRGGATAEVSMATIRDRSVLLADDGQRYRDVDVPMPVLRAVLKAAQAGSTAGSTGVPARDVEPFLPDGGSGNGALRLIFDPQVELRMQDDPERTRLLVRIYDLSDRGSARIRDMLGGVPDGGRAYFLTLRP